MKRFSGLLFAALLALVPNNGWAQSVTFGQFVAGLPSVATPNFNDTLYILHNGLSSQITASALGIGASCSTLGSFLVGTGSGTQCSTVTSSTATVVNGLNTVTIGAAATQGPYTGALSLTMTGANQGIYFSNGDSGAVVADPATFNGSFFYNAFFAGSDQVSATTGNHSVSNIYSEMWITGAAKGARRALHGISLIAGDAVTDDDVNGTSGIVFGFGPNGGTNTGAGSKGTMFGLEGIAWAFSGATNYHSIIGIEVQPAIFTGASSQNRSGINLFSGGDLQAADLDTAVSIFQGTTVAWKNGVTFVGVSPVSDCLICTDGTGATVTTGIDISAYTFTGNVFKSTNFSVDGSGNVVGNAFSQGANVGVDCPAGVTAGTVVVNKGIVTHC